MIGCEVQLKIAGCVAAGGQGFDTVLCGFEPGMKVLLSLADNWKYPGGVDQYVDWSATTPERGAAHPRPPDTEGDTDNTVRRVASEALSSCCDLAIAMPSSDACPPSRHLRPCTEIQISASQQLCTAEADDGQP